MKSLVWTATAALGVLCGCGETLHFRSDNGAGTTTHPISVAQESDASRAARAAQNSVEDPGARSAPAPENPTPAPEGTPVPNGTPAPEVLPTAPSVPVATPTPDICRGITHDVKVLVLDFKSGWFAGDGGDFFRHVVDGHCGGRVQVVYAHITKVTVEGNIWEVPEGKTLLPCIANRTDPNFITDDCRMGSLAAFDAAWVLSGSTADPDDLVPTDPLFGSVVLRLAELKNTKPQSSFFLGAGLGNVDHANLTAATLFPSLGVAFAPNPESALGILPSPEDYVKFVSQPLAAGSGAQGTFVSSAPLFLGLASLFDYAPESHLDPLTGLDLGKCFSDPIVTTKLDIVARDHCNRQVLAVGTPAGHRVVLEGNLARFYGAGGVEFLDRILRYQLEE